MPGLLLPARCTVCARSGAALCPACATALPPAPDLPCPPGLDACWSLLAYQGATRDLVAGLKYRNRRDAMTPLAAALGELVGRLAGSGGPPPVVTWCPTTARRRRDRGYDQAELLARGAARASGLPARRLLRRRPGPPQTGRDRTARLAGPHFDVARAPARVVLVDDVRTTGATLSAAATALRRAGCARVDAVTLAARP